MRNPIYDNLMDVTIRNVHCKFSVLTVNIEMQPKYIFFYKGI